ncbi:ATP phosphoribosyltransferase regulatory subunit [Anaerolentibacter hominis]|uniref:ATP phosphoribosyltransferase regulatory subunit n=1 Tax=Anaerolentibacter hominis TaxID=3079009 RepID=UPI0031B7F885
MGQFRMEQELLHIPEGVRDIYDTECARKRMIQERMHGVMELYGFKDIQTPMFEFFNVFNRERGTVSSKNMFKFIDRDGSTLVLRPDITPPIARCVAKYYAEEEFPIRLCYIGDTFVNTDSYQGKLRETTQLGVELINDSSVDADAEMIALVIDSLLQAGLSEFQVEIGHADYFNGLVEEAGLNQEEAEELRSLIERKNIFGVEEMVGRKEISDDLKELFRRLPEMFGNMESLTEIKSKTQNERARKAIERLEKLYDILASYGFQSYITVDLGMLSKYNYYTGIIFRAYTYGTGDAIVTGGRYDNLLEQFGKQAPSIGFAVVIDQLMAALSRQKAGLPPEEPMTMILYRSQDRKIAIDLGNQFRAQGIKIELVRMSRERSLKEYMEYAARTGAGGILFLEDSDTIQVIDLATGEANVAKISEILKLQEDAT